MESMILSAFAVSSQLGDESRPTEKNKRVRKTAEKALQYLLDEHQHGGGFGSEASVYRSFSAAQQESSGKMDIYGDGCATYLQLMA